MFPLKPSLVEWKRVIAWAPKGIGEYLETFLGGMETPAARQPPNRHGETLKPSLVEWKLHYHEGITHLSLTLKPSLVEWKHVYKTDLEPERRALKPSLVEWKLSSII